VLIGRRYARVVRDADIDDLRARYLSVRNDPSQAPAEFWRLSADYADELAETEPERAEEVLGLAAESFRERPRAADVELSLRILRGLSDVRLRLDRPVDAEVVHEAMAALLDHCEVQRRTDAWHDLHLRRARCALVAGDAESGFAALAAALDEALAVDSLRWMDQIALELCLGIAVEPENRWITLQLEAIVESPDSEGPARPLLLGVVALSHFSCDEYEIAGTYLDRVVNGSDHSPLTEVIVGWVRTGLLLAEGDAIGAAAVLAKSSIATDGDYGDAPHDPRLRFELLVLLAEARWDLGETEAAAEACADAVELGSVDRKRLARCHEILAEIARAEERYDEAYEQLERTRSLETRARGRHPSAVAQELADTPAVEAAPAPTADLRTRVASLEQMIDVRTRQLEQALVDLRDLSDRSSVDELTGLMNRQAFGERLIEMQEHRLACAVVAIDLDRFARLNGNLGHQVGDEVLIEVARRLLRSVRRDDACARWGGDEFMVVLSGVGSSTEAVSIAETLRQAVTADIKIGDDVIVPSISMGVTVTDAASFESGTFDPEELLKRADNALERAKVEGKDRIEVFGAEIGDRARLRFDTEAQLRAALENDLFELHFQPVHPNFGDQPLAAEALIRLRDPETGSLTLPGAFLDVAEETGLARPIGEWVIEAACKAAAEWTRFGLPFRFAINVSAAQLEPGFADLILSSLRNVGLPADTLVIELTEHTLLAADRQQIDTLIETRADGVQIALDDFGTAYSSLSHLQQFPVDVVKIDRSFVSGLSHSERDTAIVRAVVELSRTFGFRVIAEGVETIEQFDIQRRLGCHGAQGYLIGRPKPADDFGTMLSTRPMFEALAAATGDILPA
jgi:diguanylate cyclase (GGDEF)-like protein